MSAYWIAHVTVHDVNQYQKYMDLAPEAFKKFNARFLARGGQHFCLEGQPFEKHVIIQFESLTAAKNCYDSPEYALARQQRQGCCDVSVVIVESL